MKGINLSFAPTRVIGSASDADRDFSSTEHSRIAHTSAAPVSPDWFLVRRHTFSGVMADRENLLNKKHSYFLLIRSDEI